MKMMNVGVDHLRALHRGDLKGHLIVPVVERADHAGGYKLENNGISCVLPTEHVPVDTVHHGVSEKHPGPDGHARPVGDVERDKVRAAGGSVSPQGNHNGSAPDHAAENDVQHFVVENGPEGKHLQKQAAQRHLDQREGGKAQADSLAAQDGHRDVEQQHGHLHWDMKAPQFPQALHQHG